MATVLLAPGVLQELKGLPTSILARMYRIIDRLKNWPTVSGAKPLRGDLVGKYRMRPGAYRLQFRVETTEKTITTTSEVKKGKKVETVTEQKVVPEYTVVVEKVGHRDGFYDE